MGLTPVANERWCPSHATPAERSAKLALLESRFSTVVQTLPNSKPAQALLAAEMSKRKSAEQSPPGGELEKRDWGEAQDLVTAALNVPEDLCLLQLTETGYVLVAACVTAPSYWYLPDKIGLGLDGIHAPVPQLNATLGERIQSFFTGLPAHRTFLRRNWFLHGSSERFQPRSEQRALIETAEQALALSVRSETQTLRRLSQEVVVFTIAIECHPLRDIRHYPAAAQSLLSALNSRSAAERAGAGQPMYEQGVVALLSRVQGTA